MPGPNSWVFLGFLLCGAVALIAWIIRSRKLALKVAAGVLAIGISTVFGAALVNSFYDYYTSWGALYADMTHSGAVGYQAAGLAKPQLLASKTFGQSHTKKAPAQPTMSASLPTAPDVPATLMIPKLQLAAGRDAGTGRLVRLHLPGPSSGIDRLGYVYLPPQYFEPAYARTEFPVLELLHGDPGDPTNWIYGLQLPDVMDAEIHAGRVGPMVIVMPATFTGKHGNDCVNAIRGQQDDTYLTHDIAADMVADFRVLPPGPHWGIGGLSDGGYCAANLALRHRGSYGVVASMDGFYTVDADLGVLGADFGNSAALLAANDPTDEVADSTQALPDFWIMAGTGNSADFQSAQTFRSVVQSREPVRFVVLAGAKHTPPAWRAVLPDLIEWSWTSLSGRPVPTGTVDNVRASWPGPYARPARSPSP